MRGSPGRPRTRPPMMLRMISEVPPSMVLARARSVSHSDEWSVRGSPSSPGARPSTPHMVDALALLHCPRVEEMARWITATNSVRSMAASPSRSSWWSFLGWKARGLGLRRPVQRRQRLQLRGG